MDNLITILKENFILILAIGILTGCIVIFAVFYEPSDEEKYGDCSFNCTRLKNIKVISEENKYKCYQKCYIDNFGSFKNK